jgi:hypothetical protein
VEIIFMSPQVFPVVPSVFLLVGGPLFAGAVLVPIVVRTVGVVLLGIALIWTGFTNRRRPA